MTSSTGLPYTLHFALPDLPLSVPTLPQEASTPSRAIRETSIAQEDHSNETGENSTVMHDVTAHAAHNPQEGYIFSLAESLRGMYCPCTGFAYNSLAGDRNYFVSIALLTRPLAHTSASTCWPCCSHIRWPTRSVPGSTCQI